MRLPFLMAFVTTLILSLATYVNADDAANADVDDAADAAFDDAAKAAFIEARELFANKHYKAAAAKFKEAYRAKPTWKLLYNIAQSEAASKRYGLALEQFEQYLAQGGDEITADRNDDVRAEINRLREMIGILEVKTHKGASVYVDGVRRGTAPIYGGIPVSSGIKHNVTVIFESKTIPPVTLRVLGGKTIELELMLDDSAEIVTAANNPDEEAKQAAQTTTPANPDKSTTEDTVSPVAEDAPPAAGNNGLLVAGITTSVVGLVGVGLGIAFSAKGAGDYDARTEALKDYNTSGTQPDYDTLMEKDEDLKTDSTVQIIGYTVGGALIVTGAILITLHATKRKQEKLAIRPGIGGFAINF